ncbi:MAG: ATP-binding protein [Bacteroidales bacterium]|jgi:two-component system nitrogen regulation sensor histidine kinase NtrY|nr:ATP-binding protein [Bacteroidales bacterium]
MYSKSLFSAVLSRIILIIISSFAFIYVIPYLHKEYYLSLFGIGILIIYQVYNLVHYVNKTNRKLAHFFNSVRNEDSVLTYPHDNEGEIFNSLNSSLNELNSSISEMRRQNARQSIFLNNLVEQVGVGLISYTKDGNVEIYNNAAKKLLQLGQLKNIGDISKRYPELSKGIAELQPYNHQVIKIITEQSVLFLSLKLSILKSEKEKLHLLSIQNIRVELEQNELDSWQKLIRVLTHEISNSISPITSLANTTKKYFVRKETGSIMKIDELDDVLLHKTVDSLNTIETTGKGLIDFVGKYKSLTALPQPEFEKFQIRDLFDKLQTLLLEEVDSNAAVLEFNSSPNTLELTADFSLLEKVLINLIKNAFQALEKSKDGKVHVSAFKNIENKVIITVKDNGSGIPPNIMDDIFIPFYTTKNNGSGIGLSLSRQIMRLHSGTITVNSIPNTETVFSLVF